jgi:hypothetical protein
MATQQIFAPRLRVTRRERDRKGEAARLDLRPWAETPGRSARWRKPL